MSMDAASTSLPLNRFEQLRFARDVIRAEGTALLELADRLQDEICDAAARLLACRGNVIVTGMGKAGLIGQKIAATLASTGTRAHFLHPGEARHGDLGRVHSDDLVLAFSFSGATEEVTALLPSLASLQTPVIAITGRPHSPLGAAAEIILDLGPLREAGSLGLAPSTSTTAMLALGDALALLVKRLRNFRPEDFARFHPGGSLGRRLAKVDELMRPLTACRVASDQLTLRQVLIATSGGSARRTGAVMLTSKTGSLTGIFTDSDLARLLAGDSGLDLEIPIRQTMTPRPKSIASGARLAEAMAILSTCKISELPVVDDQARPVGLIDITDVVGLLPKPTGDQAQADGAGTTQAAHLAGADFPKTVPFPNQT